MLLSKFFLPELRPNRVDRPRLLERLRQAASCQLVIISAPAGFGKTSLASEWVRSEGCPTAWISLDESDNDPVRFWNGLVIAIDQLYPGAGKSSQSLLAARQPAPQQALLTALLNDLTVQNNGKADPPPAFLVLDDTHLVNETVIYDGLLYFIEHLPRNLRLVLIGRSDPPLPLGRLRASCRVLEIRAADLRFSQAESEEFFNRAMGFSLSQANVKRLEERTEGWIAGMQLAGLALQGFTQGQGSGNIDIFIDTFSGDDRYILDYLVEEVLSRLPEEMRTFLLQTAILDQMCGPLCEAVTGLPAGESQALLERCERENLFLIPLDNRRQWYRYHHLFADLLRSQLDRLEGENAKEAAGALHRRAAAWLGSHGYLDLAIHHALAGGNLEAAAQLMLQAGETAWMNGEFNTLLRWLSALPQEIRVAEPRLGILLAWSVTLSGQLGRLSAAEAELDMIEARLRPDAELPMEGSADAETFGILCTVRGVVASAFHQQDQTGLERASLALRYLPETNLVWRGAATLSIGHAHNARGDVPRALATYTEAIALNQAAGNPHLALRSAVYRIMQLYYAGKITRAIQEIQNLLPKTSLLSEAGQPTFVGAHSTSALIRYEWNQLNMAQEDIEQVIRLGERWNNQGSIILGLLYQVLTNQALEDMQAVDTALEAARLLAHQNEQSASMYADDVEALQALIWIRRGQLELACGWAARQVFPDEPVPQRDVRSTTLARVLIRSGRAGQALGYLQQACCVLEAHGQITNLMEILVLQALALYQAGQFETALQPLQHALEIGEGEGFLRVFFDEGQPMADLLKAAQPRLPERLHAYARKLTLAFPSTLSASQQAASPDLIEQLTPREIEVLRMIQAGLSNREIAEKLYLTLNTVKVHVKNIFAKLEVESRTQAVRRAGELGLL